MPAADIGRVRPADHVAEAIGATDKRRWLSFLTWAFVLAEMASRDAFLPNSAHAMDDDTGRTHPGPGDGAPIANHLPDVSISTSGESPDSNPTHKAALMAEYAPTTIASELAAVKAIPVEDHGAQPIVSHGGGGGGGVSSHADGDASTAHGDDVSGEPLSASIGHDGLPLDLGLNLTVGDIQIDAGHVLDGLLDSVGDTLGNLPLVGGLLHSVENISSDVAPSLLGPVVSLVGLGSYSGDQHSHSSDTGLPGQLHFAETGNSHAATDLSTPTGSYTSYGIAISTGNSFSTMTVEGGLHDAGDASVLDAYLPDHLVGTDHGASETLAFDQAALRTAPDALA
jgi:hypothetical protein